MSTKSAPWHVVESTIDAARRELREETGYVVGRIDTIAAQARYNGIRDFWTVALP